MNFLLIFFLLIALVIVSIFKIFLNLDSNTLPFKIGEIISNISYSYIVSYIFYLVAFIPSKRNSKKVKKILLKKSQKIITNYNSFKSDILMHPQNKNLDFNNDSDLKVALKNVHLLDVVPNNLIQIKTPTGQSNLANKLYFNTITEFKENLFITISEVKETAAIVDPDLYELLNKIETSSLFILINSLSNTILLQNVQNKNTIAIDLLYNDLIRFKETINQLETYLSRNSKVLK